jgi:hypothetical protein
MRSTVGTVVKSISDFVLFLVWFSNLVLLLLTYVVRCLLLVVGGCCLFLVRWLLLFGVRVHITQTLHLKHL